MLRDVLDLDVRETAAALEMSDSNVKVVHLRGRRKLATYDRARIDTSRAAQARGTALSQLLFAIVQQDVAAVASLLSPQVILLNDGGGQYLAARSPMRGVQSCRASWSKCRASAELMASSAATSFNWLDSPASSSRSRQPPACGQPRPDEARPAPHHARSFSWMSVPVGASRPSTTSLPIASSARFARDLSQRRLSPSCLLWLARG